MTDETHESAATDSDERPRANDVLEVEIERVVPGGAGMAHARGLTIFVPLAAPGDQLRVRVERVKGRVAFAALTEVVAAGRERVEPPCPYFGLCGGCDFQQLSYEAQLAAKVEIIRDCLRRIAHLTPPDEIPITPSPSAWHYRSRARWQHDARARHLGYYELASHRVVDVAECPVVVPELQGALARLREAVASRATWSEEAREFEAVAGDDGVSLLPPLDDGDDGERVRSIAGERYRFDAACFFQINHALLDALVHAATKDEAGEAAIDLYCGVGLFTLPLARRFARITGVEANPAAAAYARRNLSDARLTNAEIKTAQVGAWLARRAQRRGSVDLLLLDPPRAGAEHGTIESVIALAPRRVVYVSCDPATLARDLRALTAGGYTLDSVTAFDMFPQTHHVETIARLTRAA
ncbi:MAG: rRNA (uracil1939-C5)-methyltransferase [Acidobacteriota bacterium]|jgi:23S rRNA (uracil1939-C5)-methyltransferase|nr:rRNA (uracil1939-C5)-methyltransferase [Acidobacteriota bacterium]